MYRNGQDADKPGDEWLGPARIVGFDEKTVNLTHGTMPVMSSLHKLRPASAAEMMAYQVLSRNMRPVAPQILVAPGQQVGIIDARAPRAASSAPMPAATSQPSTSASSSQNVPQDMPRLVVADTTLPPMVERSETRPVIVDHYDRTALERHLDAMGHSFNDPGRRLAATLLCANAA